MQNASLRVLDTNMIYTTLELWLEALQARKTSPRTVENYHECVTPFVLRMLRECLKTISAQQLKVAGNPKRSLLRRLRTCASRFCPCVARD
jgi:hypothetical protein